MKKSKKSKNRYCKECIPLVGDVPDGTKALMCASDDCNNIFYVDVRNMTKCRCDNCQIEYRKVWDRERKRALK